jgi:adiponectin receptor
MKILKDSVQENVYKYTGQLVSGSVSLLENASIKNFLDDFNSKLDLAKQKLLDILEMDEIVWETKYLNSNRRVKRWPIFVMLTCAIICLSCSYIFHWFSAHSKTANDFLSRLDYGGISILIAGSCYPPYFYFFNCEKSKIIFNINFSNKKCLSSFYLYLCTYRIFIFVQI